jgi:TIR domain-containing protein
MPDIFISYAKPDHALALKLSAFLEAEGWTVWWDKSLGAAGLYREEIMKQLAAARAVISIWTENSVKSDWVRAEAGRAKAEGKLIPVKTADVTYGDIPPSLRLASDNKATWPSRPSRLVDDLLMPRSPLPMAHTVSRTFPGLIDGRLLPTQDLLHFVIKVEMKRPIGSDYGIAVSVTRMASRRSLVSLSSTCDTLSFKSSSVVSICQRAAP